MQPGDAVLENGRMACPVCHSPVSEPYRAGDFLVRRHLERLGDGTVCPHGHGEGEPIAAVAKTQGQADQTRIGDSAN